MDKIFVLSTKDTLKEFQKNPRRYIDQLRSPCKLFLYGPRVSGIEQLAQDLSKKYNATVSTPLDLREKNTKHSGDRHDRLLATESR